MSDYPSKKYKTVHVSKKDFIDQLRAVFLTLPSEHIASHLAETLLIIQKMTVKDLLRPEVKKELEEDIERYSDFVTEIIRELKTTYD